MMHEYWVVIFRNIWLFQLLMVVWNIVEGVSSYYHHMLLKFKFFDTMRTFCDHLTSEMSISELSTICRNLWSFLWRVQWEATNILHKISKIWNKNWDLMFWTLSKSRMWVFITIWETKMISFVIFEECLTWRLSLIRINLIPTFPNWTQQQMNWKLNKITIKMLKCWKLTDDKDDNDGEEL